MRGATIVPVPAGDDRVLIMNKIDSSSMLRIAKDGDAWSVEELWTNNAINFGPPEGQPPGAAFRSNARVTLTFRPVDRLRIENQYFLTELDDDRTGGRIFTNQILRTQWSWQFNRRLSLRAILQIEDTDADQSLSNLEDTRNFNGDVLLTYLVHPGTAIYVGYNGNLRNVALEETPGGMRVVPTEGDLNMDAEQFFVKASYLFRF